MAAKEDVVGRPELVTPVRRSLLLLAFPGPVLGSRSGIAAACAHADSEAVEGWRSNCPCSPRARSAALLTPATVRAQMGAPSERAALLMTKLLARSRRGSGMQVTEYETDSRVDSVHDSFQLLALNRRGSGFAGRRQVLVQMPSFASLPGASTCPIGKDNSGPGNWVPWVL